MVSLYSYSLQNRLRRPVLSPGCFRQKPSGSGEMYWHSTRHSCRPEAGCSYGCRPGHTHTAESVTIDRSGNYHTYKNSPTKSQSKQPLSRTNSMRDAAGNVYLKQFLRKARSLFRLPKWKHRIRSRIKRRRLSSLPSIHCRIASFSSSEACFRK